MGEKSKAGKREARARRTVGWQWVPWACLLVVVAPWAMAADEPALTLVPEATPEEPFVAPEPTGIRASRLAGVEVLEQDASTLVRIVGDGEFAFSSFRLEDPPRFVVDLDGAVKTAAASSVAVSSPVVERVRLAQFKSRPEPVSRVVFDLLAEARPWMGRDDSGLLVRFGVAPTREASEQRPGELSAEPIVEEALPRFEEPAASAAEGEPAAVVVAEETEPEDAAPATAELDSLVVELTAGAEEADEARAEPGVAMAAAEPPIQLAQARTGAGGVVETTTVTVAQQEQEPEVEVTVEEEAREPAAGVAVEQEMEEPTSLPEGIVFEGPVSDEPQIPSFGVTTVTGEREYFGAPISMSLKDADITEVLRSIARISGLNIVIQPGVSGPVTVELESVPWDQALEQVLKIHGLGMELDGNILRIAPVSQLAQEAREQQQLQAAKALSVPLTTVMRRVSYAQAGEIAGILQRGAGGGIMSQRGSVIVDSRTNTLIIQELPEYMDQVIQIIENLDIPEEQVMIEARIVETTKNWARSVGIAWNFDYIADAPHGNSTGLEFPNNIESEGGVNLLTGGNNAFLNLAMGNILNTFQLDAMLIAAENEGLINVVSAPKVATLNNERASIQSGLQIPVQTVANNTVTVQFVNATLRLDVTPHITAEGTVLLEIQIQKREPQQALAVVGAPSAPIATREARTRVLVRDGGTAVIGGIYEVSTNENEDRVPGLSNIPILGHLFRNRNRSNTNEELLIFITPRIIQL